MDKAAIRREALSRRDSIGHDLKKAKDERIMGRVLGLPEFEAARTVLLYVSFKSEVDTIPLIRHCLENGKRVVLPKVDREENELLLFEIKNMEELAPGCFGIPEPSVGRDRKAEVHDMDLVIVPGVAFDERRNRLGYGKGFYDNLLKSKRSPAIALSYEDQIVPALPAESHDVRMDKVVTDKRIINCHE